MSPFALVSRCAVACLLASSCVYADLAAWQAAVGQGASPASAYFKDQSGPAISGHAPVRWDVGALGGEMSFEFVVFAGDAGQSAALLGFAGQSALKFEQWQNTASLGVTQFGVADHNSGIPAPLYQEAHVVFTSDGNDTHLYVNGEWQHTFSGYALTISGEQWLGGFSDAGGVNFFDRLDGHILGFASYGVVLGEEEIAAHHAALAQGARPYFLGDWQSAVAAGTAPTRTVFDPVSSLAPQVVELGEFPEGVSTFEFVVRAGDTSGSNALLGLGGAQGLKYDQWQNSGFLGVTNFGVADIISEAAAIYHEVAHVAYVDDGAATTIYLNGEAAAPLDAVALAFSGSAGLAAVASIPQTVNGKVYNDRLDGQVLRFASYGAFMDESEITAHYAAFAADAGAQAFTAWQAAAGAGTTPAYTLLEPASGTEPQMAEIGAFTGARTFEFIVNAGDAGVSACLLGNGVQGLKFEQYNNLGTLGITDFGDRDIDSGVPSPLLADAHILYTSDGADTYLYVNGELAHVFAGVPLRVSGLSGIAANIMDPVTTFSDPLDGHVLGFAAYAAALGAEEIAAHARALREGAPPAAALKITHVALNAATGQLTLAWESTPGKSYAINYSATLASFGGVAATGIPAAAGSTTTHTFAIPEAGAPQLFFRVKEL